MNELDRVRTQIAEAESRGGPYVAESVAALRKRLARLEAVSASAASASAPAIPVAAPAAAARIKPTPTTGTREDRLKRLAKAMGADGALLAEAMASGMTPDAFALEVIDSNDPKAVAMRIANSDKPVMRNAVPEVEEMAQRILGA